MKGIKSTNQIMLILCSYTDFCKIAKKDLKNQPFL
nr:MAG TPA: hypothetical protein [Caudoviricetes sp.]DAY72492.1 MAG TPA: hypothetical protein [Caudoviricetes sp.]